MIKELLKLKGKHKICVVLPVNDDDPDNLFIVMEYGEKAEKGIVEDYTPDWLYKILDKLGASEEIESGFTLEPKNVLLLLRIADKIYNYYNWQ